MTACVPGAEIPPIGVTKIGSRYELLIGGCDVPIKSIDLGFSRDLVVDSRDHRFWRIVTDEPRAVHSLTIGKPPTAFREDVTYDSSWLTNAIAFVQINKDLPSQITGEIKPKLIREEMVWYFTKNVSREQFESETACRG
jgi:hypothetical protein